MFDHFICNKMYTVFLFFVNFIVINQNILCDRVAYKKCQEYAEYVFHSEESPVLRIDTGPKKIVSKCGIVETPLIVGGLKAKPMEFPHMAAIGYGNDGDIFWQCGGSVISENYILTAAHCINSNDRGPATKVRVGFTNLKTEHSSSQERNIIDIIAHPDYQIPKKYNDLALFKLDEPLDLNADVRPACLEMENLEQRNFNKKMQFIATGFGKTAYEADSGSDDLMKVMLDYITPETCEKNYQTEKGSRQMPEGLITSMLCAGVMEGGKDTCQGDSGGPLQRVLHEPYCMYSIVGITSFGKFCAFENSPAIYTKVSSYLDWIEKIVWPE